MFQLPDVLSSGMRLMIGAQARWIGTEPNHQQRIYYANHSSHLDSLAIWSALPRELRATTRPVAAKDYWEKTRLRRYISQKGFQAIYLDRQMNRQDGLHPLQSLFDALEGGSSLIFFPEGTRGTEPHPGAFKSGMFHLAKRFPSVEWVPVYLENLYRSMPKGTFWPLPLICTVRFGSPLQPLTDEPKNTFLERARAEVVKLA